MFSRKNKKPKLDPLQQKREDDRLKEEARRGKILKEKLYPAILEFDEPIAKVKIFLQVFQMALEQGHMKTRATMSVSDLKLQEDLKDNPAKQQYENLFSIMNEEKIEVAVDLVKSMNQIIENNLQDENKERKISTLHLKYFDEN